MKEWLTGLLTRYSRYEIYIDSSKYKPFGILCNNKPLPKRYSTIWNAIQAMKYSARDELLIRSYTSTIDTLEDVCPQTHEYFIKHYLTGKYIYQPKISKN